MYAKLTVKNFKARLDNNDYGSATGARRAVGKMSTWSEEEKKKAHALVNKHFGVDDSPSKPTAKKVSKKGKKRVAKKKGKAAEASSEKVAKKATKKKRVKRRKKGKKRAANKAAAKSASKAPKKRGPRKAAAKQQSSAKPAATASELARINLVGERVGTVTQAIKAMETAKQHGADIKDGMQRAQNVLTQSVAELEQHVERGTNGTSSDESARKFAESASAAVSPGAQSPDFGESTLPLDTLAIPPAEG